MTVRKTTAEDDAVVLVLEIEGADSDSTLDILVSRGIQLFILERVLRNELPQ